MITTLTLHRIIRPLEGGVRELDVERDRALLTTLSSKWVDELGRMFWSAASTSNRVISIVFPEQAWLQATLRKRDDTWVVNGLGVHPDFLHRGLGSALLHHLEPPIEAKCLEENPHCQFWFFQGFRPERHEDTSVHKTLTTWRRDKPWEPRCVSPSDSNAAVAGGNRVPQPGKEPSADLR